MSLNGIVTSDEFFENFFIYTVNYVNPVQRVMFF